MIFRSEDIDGVRVITTPPTEIDAGNAEEFKRDISPLLDGASKVAIDLSSVQFMDSAGLGAMLSAFKKVRAEGGQFKAFGLTKEVRELFELVRMQRLFDVYDDKEKAIEALQS